jgi:hypothetical protein
MMTLRLLPAQQLLLNQDVDAQTQQPKPMVAHHHMQMLDQNVTHEVKSDAGRLRVRQVE